MSLIAFFDFTSTLMTFFSILVLFLKWKRTSYPGIRYLLLGLLSLSLIYYLSLFVEWSGITSSLEKLEDLIGAMIPMVWAFIFYTFLQLISNKDLHNSEIKYRHLIQNSGDMIFLMYHNKFEVINKKFEDVFHLTLEDVNNPGFELKQLFVTKSHPEFNKILGQMSHKKKSDSIPAFSSLSEP